ncbi:hypothetical protein [Streptomyces sp. NPDC014764]|uniref:hypothetical protein n=1 Tax=Streptomyces sp. NPDC014764 TaxID=3364907 RepID=UPI003702509F
MKSQTTAAEYLKAYFDQPLDFSSYPAVERLLTDAILPEEQRAEVVAALVQTIDAGPGRPAPQTRVPCWNDCRTCCPGGSERPGRRGLHRPPLSCDSEH